MKKCLFIFILSLSITPYAFSFNHTHPTKKDTSVHSRIIFSAGAGFFYTSLNFLKNYQEDTYSRGFGGRILVQVNERLRFSADVSQVQSVNIQPMWINVNNTFFDLDVHALMHFADGKSIAYFTAGLSGQYWDGFYTGQHDINSWRLNAKPNSMYHAFYYGATMGFGAEARLIGPISIYGEFRFRFSKTDVGTGLSDVLYNGGIKLNLPTLKRGNKRHSFLHFRDKYHWF